LNPATQRLLGELAEAAQIPFSGDVPEFLQSLAAKHEKLRLESEINGDLIGASIAKVAERNAQLDEKRQRIQELSETIQSCQQQRQSSELEATQMQHTVQRERLREMKQIEARALRAAAKAVGLENPATKSRTELATDLAIALDQRVLSFLQAKAAREHRRVAFAERLQRGIRDLEGATDTIVRANRRLIHDIDKQ
jgi:hypothetical protein